MIVNGADRGFATAAPTAPTFAHATRATCRDTFRRDAEPGQRARTDYTGAPGTLTFASVRILRSSQWQCSMTSSTRARSPHGLRIKRGLVGLPNGRKPQDEP